jgi:hypothetical protein
VMLTCEDFSGKCLESRKAYKVQNSIADSSNSFNNRDKWHFSDGEKKELLCTCSVASKF